MKSFRRICLIVTVVVVLFLLIGLPGNSANNSSDTTRTLTMQPSISLDQTSDSSNQGELSTLQTSTSLFVQSSQLNVGIQSGTSTLTLNDDLYQQIESLYINNEIATGKQWTQGSDGGDLYDETNTYDGIYDKNYPQITTDLQEVLYETNVTGTTTGVSGATLDDADSSFETLNEDNNYGSISTELGELHTSGEKIYYIWFDDGLTIDLSKNERIHVTSWDTTTVSGTITSVELYVRYSVETGYAGNNFIQYNTTNIDWTDTTIQPASGDDLVASSTLAGIDTINKLQNINIKFKNNTPAEPRIVEFEQIWLLVTVSSPVYRLNVMHEISGVSPTAGTNQICIYGNRDAEDITVQVFNTDAEWETIAQINSDSAGWYNTTINTSTQIIDSSYIFIRYLDTVSVSDITPNNAEIDAAFFESTGAALDLYYTFEWTGNEGDVANISVYDVSNGSQDMKAYIRDFQNDLWILLNFDIDSTVSNHSEIISTNPEYYLEDGTGAIWIRYAQTSSANTETLNVDYLAVKVHNFAANPPGAWDIDMIYNIQDFSGDRSEVTQITVTDYSNITNPGDQVKVQIYDYTNNQWDTCFLVAEDDEKQHNVTFSSSPSNYISSNPGDIQIRYILDGGSSFSYSLDYLEVTVETADGGGGGGGDGGGGGGDGGGGGGGTTVIRTLSAQITYPEEIEKFVPAEIDVILIDDEGLFVSNASVSLTFGNETESYTLEEKGGQYTLVLETDTLETGNYTFTISAEKSGFRDFLSSAFPFMIVVKYPFATAVQYPEYWSEYRSQAVENPISVLLDPSAYVLPLIAATLIFLQVTTFASIDPRKLRSIYVFTNEGQGLYYRTFFEEKGSVDSQLMSAALSGIVSLVMEATRSERPMRTIDIETFEIFLEYGQYVTIATFVGKRIFYKRKIRRGQKKLINDIERKYGYILANWDGDISYFYEMDQFVFDAFDFKATKDLSKLIAGAADVQLELVSLYSAQEKFHMSGRALWKAYDLYASIQSPRAQFILERWKALEKAYLADYVGSTSVLKTRLLSQFFKLLDFIRTASLLKMLYRIRSIIYPEISKDLYYFIPPEQLTERTDEGI